MEFSRQEYWSGLPFSSPGDLPNPGIEPGSPALQADFLPSEPPGKPPLHGKYRGKSRSSDRFYFLYCRWLLQPLVVFWKESYDKPRQHIKKQRHHFANKDPYSQIYGFSNSHVQMWQLDHKEGWASEELMLLNCGAGEDSTVPWTARRSNQSILKDIKPEYSLERLKVKGEGGNRGWDG